MTLYLLEVLGSLLLRIEHLTFEFPISRDISLHLVSLVFRRPIIVCVFNSLIRDRFPAQCSGESLTDGSDIGDGINGVLERVAYEVGMRALVRGLIGQRLLVGRW